MHVMSFDAMLNGLLDSSLGKVCALRVAFLPNWSPLFDRLLPGGIEIRGKNRIQFDPNESRLYSR